MNSLEVKNLVKSYMQGDGSLLKVLDGVSFTVSTENIAIMGESGSGKTTLLNCVSGLDSFDSGRVYIDGIDLTRATEREKSYIRSNIISFVFQFHYLITDFTVLENVLLPMQIAKRDIKMATREAKDILQELGIYSKKDTLPTQLSGGEKQRVAIARALITKPKLLFMDEPTGNLDEELSINIVQNILKTSTTLNTKIVMVTHDSNIASMMDKIYIVNNKNLEEKTV